MPLLWLSLAFLAGIIIADNAALPTITWVTLAGVALGLSLLFFVIQQIRVRRSYGAETSSTWIIRTPITLLAITLGGIRGLHSLT